MKRLWLIVLALFASSIILPDLLDRHHAHAEFWWQVTPAFDLFYGFAGCVGLILMSKWLGHAWLQRDENFYEDDRP